jgi:hypothetical protein
MVTLSAPAGGRNSPSASPLSAKGSVGHPAVFVQRQASSNPAVTAMVPRQPNLLPDISQMNGEPKPFGPVPGHLKRDLSKLERLDQVSTSSDGWIEPHHPSRPRPSAPCDGISALARRSMCVQSPFLSSRNHPRNRWIAFRLPAGWLEADRSDPGLKNEPKQ